ncbi:MAG: tetratricopeptide repeat protein [Candidatus Deferrimicrobiaceae bacterium]
MGVKGRNRKGMVRFLTFGLITLLFSLSMAGPAYSGQFGDAVAAYERGDYATAFRLMKPLAEKGDAKAQHNLGVMYDYGRGVPQANNEALRWYRKAAEQGLPDAQHNLGLIYAAGQGVPQDHSMAGKWYRRAAEQGLPEAQVNLGIMYYNGQGVPQDYILAHMWLNIAASQYPASVKKSVNDVVNYREIVHAKMTPAQVAEAQRLAREWKPKKEAR